jgi:hypothetical protein
MRRRFSRVCQLRGARGRPGLTVQNLTIETRSRDFRSNPFGEHSRRHEGAYGSRAVRFASAGNGRFPEIELQVFRPRRKARLEFFFGHQPEFFIGTGREFQRADFRSRRSEHACGRRPAMRLEGEKVFLNAPANPVQIVRLGRPIRGVGIFEYRTAADDERSVALFDLRNLDHGGPDVDADPPRLFLPQQVPQR